MAQPPQYLPGYYYGAPPAAYSAVRAAEPVGGVVMPPRRAITMVPQNQNTLTDTAVNLGGIGAEALASNVAKSAVMSTVAKVAAPVALVASAYQANRAASKDEAALIEQFRDEIAQQRNIAPEAVGRKELYETAEHSPILQERLHAMHQQTFTNPLKTGAGIAAALGVGVATAGLGWIPMLAAGIAASTAASYGADALVKNAGVIPPEYTAKANIDAMLQAKDAGSAVTASDVFTLFSKADSQLGKLVEDRAGTTAEKASPDVLSDIMQHYHPNMNASCEQLANMINKNELKPEALAFINPRDLTDDKQAVVNQLKAQAANSNIPQTMINPMNAIYDGKGVSYLAANANRPVAGQFTGRIAAEQSAPSQSQPTL